MTILPFKRLSVLSAPGKEMQKQKGKEAMLQRAGQCATEGGAAEGGRSVIPGPVEKIRRLLYAL